MKTTLNVFQHHIRQICLSKWINFKIIMDFFRNSVEFSLINLDKRLRKGKYTKGLIDKKKVLNYNMIMSIIIIL